MNRRLQVLVLTLVLACSPVGICSGQPLDRFGFRAGVNSSKLSDNIIELNRTTGFQLAVTHEFIRLPVFSIRLELEYSQRGYVSEQVETDGAGNVIAIREATTRLRYLSLPLLLHIRGPSLPKVQPYLLTGPQVDWMIGRTPGTWKFTSVTVRDDYSDYLEKRNLGLIIGFGASVEIPSGANLQIEIRRVVGLSDLLPDFDMETIKMWGVDISLGISL